MYILDVSIVCTMVTGGSYKTLFKLKTKILIFPQITLDARITNLRKLMPIVVHVTCFCFRGQPFRAWSESRHPIILTICIFLLACITVTLLDMHVA